MFSVNVVRASPKSAVSLQSIRTAKRIPAYPRYRAEEAPLSHPKKDHSGFFRRHMKAWLGPKNIKGEYYRNKYYYPSQNNQPNYIVGDGHSVVKPGQDSYSRPEPGINPSLNPFPHNPSCKTASIISSDLKQKIYSEVAEKNALAQEVAQKYGIKLSRVEAVVRLQQVENSWREKGLMDEDLDKFSGVMNKIFPLFEPSKNADNLTEIPTPHKTLHQRFLTISEAEPFGPINAAEIFDLEPAQKTLDNLSELKHNGDEKVEVKKVVVGQQRQGDKAQFNFTMATSGNVGFRYGASRRDRKKNRAVSFDKLGRMVYSV